MDHTITRGTRTLGATIALLGAVPPGVCVLGATLLGCTPPPPSERRDEPSVARPSPKGERSSPTTVASDSWAEHRSTRCGFAVKLPGPLSKQPTPPGLLDQLATEDNLAQVALLASCGDVPSVGSPREFLEITSGVIVRQFHATVDRRAELDLQGRPGLELVMSVPEADKPPTIPWPGDLSYRLRLYVAGTRQYQVHALHSADSPVDDMVERFFAGFRLLDQAPLAAEPLTWSVQSIAGLTVEAPGTAQPLNATTEGLVTSVKFGSQERSTPYALSIWTHELPGALEAPTQRLRAHFMLRIATEHTEIIEESPGTLAGRPMLELVYRPNLPLPDHIAPQDTRIRTEVQELIERNPSEFRMRLVLAGDRIVQLLVAGGTAKDEPESERFLGSLRFPAPDPGP